MVEVDYLGSGGLVEDEFVVGQGLVQAGLQDGERDVVFLFRAFDLDFRGEADAVVVLVVGVAGVGDDVFGFVIDELAVGTQVESAEDDFALTANCRRRSCGSRRSHSPAVRADGLFRR